MISVNSTTTTMDQTIVTQETPEIVETYYTIESDNTNLTSETMTTQGDDSSLYCGLVVQNADNNATLYVGTVIVNTNSEGIYSQITATNNSRKSVQWALISTTTGQSLYTTSTKYGKNSVCTIDLKAITTLKTDNQFKLKAVVDNGKDSTSSMILKFDGGSRQTANFKVTGTAVKTSVSYVSTSPN
ncbi:MAG: hypothetical protein ACRDA5_10535 [Clostridium sp.]